MHTILLCKPNNFLEFIIHLYFPTGKSDKENSKDCSEHYQDYSHASPVKQTKTEIEGKISKLEEKEEIAKGRLSLSLGKHEGMFNAMKVAQIDNFVNFNHIKTFEP